MRNFGASEHEFYIPVTVSKSDAEAMTSGVFGRIVNDARQQSWSRFASAIPGWLAGLLLPPAVLLAVGAILAWVLRGFARHDQL